jgi:hypothetical protein
VDAVADVADVHLRFERGPAAFELTGTPSTGLDFLGEAAGAPDSAFDTDELERARCAWQGDVEAALSLPGQWSGEVSVNHAAPLQTHDGGRAWRAVRALGVVVDAIAAYPWRRAGELIRENHIALNRVLGRFLSQEPCPSSATEDARMISPTNSLLVRPPRARTRDEPSARPGRSWARARLRVQGRRSGPRGPSCGRTDPSVRRDLRRLVTAVGAEGRFRDIPITRTDCGELARSRAV